MVYWISIDFDIQILFGMKNFMQQPAIFGTSSPQNIDFLIVTDPKHWFLKFPRYFDVKK